MSYGSAVEWQPCARRLLCELLGSERFEACAAALATPPGSTCVRVNTLRAAPADVRLALEELLSGTGASVSAAHADAPEALLVRSAGGCAPLDLVAACGREVAVTRKTAEAVLRGAEVYAGGVVGASVGVEEEQLVLVTAVVEPLGATSCGMTRGTKLARLAAGEPPPRLLLGIGRTRLSRSQLFRAVDGLAVTLVERVYPHSLAGEALMGSLRGCLQLQNLPSILAARALSPPPGSRVLDMCAAPGGKTTALAALMGDDGYIVALDVNAQKIAHIHALCAEMGVACVRAFKADAGKALAGAAEAEEAAAEAAAALALHRGDSGRAAGAPKLEARRARKAAGAALRRVAFPPPRAAPAPPAPSAAAEAPPFAAESFGSILLDAPCSALGLRPRLSQQVGAAALANYASYQRRLLRTAVALLRPGGALVFSTCTVSPLENEANVGWLLAEWPCMRLAPHGPRLGGPGLTGPADGGAAWLTAEQAALVQRFTPGEHDTIGFFIARFVKAEAESA